MYLRIRNTFFIGGIKFMKFVAILFGVIIGVLLFLGLITLFLYNKFKKFTSGLGVSTTQFKEMIETSEYEAKYRIKSIGGMTNILVPKIIKDFPNFSESELYSKVETSLRLIFASLEKKYVDNKKELVIIRNNLEEVVNDLKSNNIDLIFDEVVFHKHVIDDYKKDSGVLTITVQTALEYFYQEKKNGKEIYKRNEWKKQTSYTTEFIYVYNPDEYADSKTLLGVRCPNCGAPVKNLGAKSCSYCSSAVEDINLKSWFISSYKEDER